MKLKDLKAKRAKLLDELRAINSAAGDAGELSPEQRSKYDAGRAEIESLNAAIERAEFIDEIDRRTSGERIAGTGDRSFDAECRQFSLRAAIASLTPDIAQGIDFGREREISAELQRRGLVPSQGGIMVPMHVFEQRVVTTAAPVAGPGSNLVATDHLAGQYIDILRARMVVQARGGRVLSGLTGNVSIPAMKAGNTAEWIAENGSLTGGDPQFRSVTMAPKHVGTMTEISRNMLLQTSPDIEQLIRLDFADALAQGVDRVAINGGGSNEPDGILQASIGSFSGATWAGILSAPETLALANADVGALGWAMNAACVRKLRSTLKVPEDAGAGFIMRDDAMTLLGYGVSQSNNVPGDPTGSPTAPSTIIFGNWSDVLVGYWGGFEILVNPYETTAYAKGNVKIRALLTADVAIRHAESFTADATFSTAA